MPGFYLGALEGLIARAHPAIARVAVTQAAGGRDRLMATVHAPEPDRPAIREALARSEPSFRPDGYSLDYAFADPVS